MQCFLLLSLFLYRPTSQWGAFGAPLKRFPKRFPTTFLPFFYHAAKRGHHYRYLCLPTLTLSVLGTTVLQQGADADHQRIARDHLQTPMAFGLFLALLYCAVCGSTANRHLPEVLYQHLVNDGPDGLAIASDVYGSLPTLMLRALNEQIETSHRQ